MMTFYAAAGSYQIRSEDGKNMPYIMRLGKLQPVSIPEFSLWSNVPLRTQGWINEKLTSVTIENGKCEHLRYMRAKGAQCSQRFFDCMSELIHNVCAETEG